MTFEPAVGSVDDAVLDTKRLRLHRWLDADVRALAKLNSDPEVMEFLGVSLTSEQTTAMVDRFEAEWEDRGYGLFAVTWIETNESIGFIGLHEPSFSAHFTPCVEIGWRLARPAWGRGLATEGAAAVRDWAFGTLELDELVSMTARINLRSRRVMEKIGFTCDPADDFDHPSSNLVEQLRPHVLYRARRSDWDQARNLDRTSPGR